MSNKPAQTPPRWLGFVTNLLSRFKAKPAAKTDNKSTEPPKQTAADRIADLNNEFNRLAKNTAKSIEILKKACQEKEDPPAMIELFVRKNDKEIIRAQKHLKNIEDCLEAAPEQEQSALRAQWSKHQKNNARTLASINASQEELKTTITNKYGIEYS